MLVYGRLTYTDAINTEGETGYCLYCLVYDQEAGAFRACAWGKYMR